MTDYNRIPSPCYVINETRLRRNLTKIASLSERAGVEIIMAFKAFAGWQLFPLIKEYIRYTTASSLAEARLAVEEMGSRAHTYAPVYTDAEFPTIAACSSHITFNSLSQFEKFYPQLAAKQSSVSCGLRINPEVSVVETDLYNPAKAGSRLGIPIQNMPKILPDGVEGLHFHVLCESSSFDLEKVLAVVEEKFGQYLSQIRWLNMGGGHLITRQDYDTEHLLSLLQKFKSRHPHLQIILEPGAAFVWQSGELIATVQDVVENNGIRTAILDVSFACHMPDCLEMPYQPEIRYEQNNQYIVAPKEEETNKKTSTLPCRLGGNSCLSGDFVGNWLFERELLPGDRIVFMDMIHYTMVKTTMFNGVSHPAFGLWTAENEFQLQKQFDYHDYKNRMG